MERETAEDDVPENIDQVPSIDRLTNYGRSVKDVFDSAAAPDGPGVSSETKPSVETPIPTPDGMTFAAPAE